jgi:hypothetical protein
MSLKVPRVYDNTESKGYRKIQPQMLVGYVYVDKNLGDNEVEPLIKTYNLVNKTHKVAGSYVTYRDSTAYDVMWRYTGSNKTGVFKNVNLMFSLDLDPSYNIGADEPDNTLIITLSGYGSSESIIRGGVTGHIGCGCTANGHVSPTRTLGCLVNDKAPLHGTFSMRRVARYATCTLR